MFSSSTSHNPFISSSYVDLSPYMIHHHHELDHNNTFLLHHHQNPHSISPLISTDHHHHHSMKHEIQVSADGDFVHQYGLIGTTTSSSVSLADKRPPKKDRHSKIYTAQGLRDRRVRLSIQIARKFFDLQDLLGFDKASKTLEWLLNKSNKAIKELSQNIDSNNNTTADSTCEQVISAEEEEDDDNVISKNERKMKKMKKNSNLQVAAKELREKARARARERTRIKLLSNTSQNLNQSKLTLLNQPQFHHQQLSSSSSSPSSSSYSNTIGDSILNTRKLKQSTMMGYQQNLFFLRDSNFPNLPPNGDNAMSSMNGSTGAHVHLHGKGWEAENSKWL